MITTTFGCDGAAAGAAMHQQKDTNPNKTIRNMEEARRMEKHGSEAAGGPMVDRGRLFIIARVWRRDQCPPAFLPIDQASDR
ncbi:MAG: hypothetical protein AAGF31_02740 [Planctomycetota bacterium]